MKVKFHYVKNFLTRGCNIWEAGSAPCVQFCSVPSQRRQRTLSTEEWKKVFSIEKELGFGFVSLLGGEPMYRKDIYELLRYAYEIDLPYTLISNSTLISESSAKRLVEEAKLRSYTASVDRLVQSPKEDIRSYVGLKALLMMKRLGVEDVTANTVIHRGNYTELPKMIEWLTEKGIWWIGVLIQSSAHPEDNRFDYRSWDCNSTFKHEDLPKLKEVCEKIARMKRSGDYLIHNYPEYFEFMPTYASPEGRFGFHCKNLLNWSVDEDGTLMACHDWRGKFFPRITIFELKEKLDFLAEKWPEEVSSCPGCYWNNWFQSELAEERGVRPFHLHYRLREVEV